MRNSQGIVEDADHTARRAVDSPAFRIFAHVGYAAKAVVYLIIGGLALAAALTIGGGLTDQSGASKVIYHQPFGAFLLILVAIGWFGYALWCVVEAMLDPSHYGTDAKGVVVRVGYTVVGVIYAILAVVSFGLATGKSSGGASTNAEAQDWTARLLAAPGGPALVVLVGLVVLGVAGALAYRAYSADFRKRLSLEQASNSLRKGVVALGRIGNGALAAVFVVIGIFFILAAAQHNPGKAKGLSGALDVVLQQPFGHLLLALVALGLLAYGVFSLAQARYARIYVAQS